jgi:hypothetical protein
VVIFRVFSDFRRSTLAPGVMGESSRGLDPTEDVVGPLNRSLPGRWCQVMQVLGGSKKGGKC